METTDTEPFIARGLRHLAAALGGRMEIAARFERPLEALAEDYYRERLRAQRESAARRDFERAWKTY
jgi:hypothetical protein